MERVWGATLTESDSGQEIKVGKASLWPHLSREARRTTWDYVLETHVDPYLIAVKTTYYNHQRLHTPSS